MAKKDQDTLDKTIAFLQKREGIDKALKIIRYTSRLLAAVSPPGSESRARFDALQSSIGTSRKAYRLGKFLQDVNSIRQVSLAHGTTQDRVLGALQIVSSCGEGMYYFLDQYLWLLKTGFIKVPKQQEKTIQKVSAWSEAIGYVANIIISCHKLRQLQVQELALRLKLRHDYKEDGCVDVSLLKQVQMLRSARLLRLALIAQDLADSLLALHDITDGRYQRMSHPVILSVAGLLSAAVSTYKYWGT